MDLEKNYLVQEFFSIYKNLLTNHQKEIFKSYYFDNLSLTEIAENLKISRQAVKDILDRCEKSLYSFEDCLKIYEKNDKILNNLKGKVSESQFQEIEKIIYKRK